MTNSKNSQIPLQIAVTFSDKPFNNNLEISYFNSRYEDDKDNDNEKDNIVTEEIDFNSNYFDSFKGQIFIYDLKALYKKLHSQNATNSLFNLIQNSYKNKDVSLLDLNLVQYLTARPITLAKNAQQTLLEGHNYYLTLDDNTKYLWQEIESPLAIILAQMEIKGVLIDKERLQIVANTMLEKIKSQELKLFTLLGSNTINLNSPSQLGQYLHLQGVELKKIRKTGNYTTDRQSLELIMETTDNQVHKDLIQAILDYRGLFKLYSTYTVNLIEQLDDNSRLHGKFNQMIVPTGRLSSNDPNLQNIPIRNTEFGSLIRSTFIASNSNIDKDTDKKVLIKADYSQIELRLLAHFSQDENLIAAFKNNEDIHKRTAANIFDITIDQVSKEQRSIGKTLNFALIYQQGVFATSRMLGISQKEAKLFIEKYFSAFPKVKPFIEETIELARQNGFVESLMGRRRYFINLNSNHSTLKQADERAAFNAVLQGSNADLIKIAMIEIDKQLKNQNLDGEIILQVHDELVIEASSQDSNIIANIIYSAMSKPPKELLIPIKVDISSGPNWSDQSEIESKN
jgi:DNA polymerase I